jgi:hypothetical protein
MLIASRTGQTSPDRSSSGTISSATNGKPAWTSPASSELLPAPLSPLSSRQPAGAATAPACSKASQERPARGRRGIQAVDHAAVAGQHENLAGAEQRQPGLRQGAVGRNRWSGQRCEGGGDVGGIAGHPDRDLAESVRSIQRRLFLRRAQHGALLAYLIGLEQSGATHRMREGLEVAPHRDRIEAVRLGERPGDHISSGSPSRNERHTCAAVWLS